MKLENLQNYIKSYKKGTYTKIGWITTLENNKTKQLNYKVEKVVNGTVRLGINYQHTTYAKSHQPVLEVKKPLWFHHTEIKEIIEHNISGRKYLQCYTSPNLFKVKWLLNGSEVTEQYLLNEKLLNESETKKSKEICIMSIPIENITKIGKGE